MSSSYYRPGPERSERVVALFERIARRYDLINDVQSLGLHRRWKRRVVREAALKPGQSALDVCCGTGDIALRLAADSSFRVIGCDFSREMLARGSARGSTRIHWVQADALNLPFADSAFDVVTIGYGLRNLADYSRGIDELVRVLAPGGRLLILEFGKPDNLLWRKIYFAYLRLFVPSLGLTFCRDSAAYGYILDSLRDYPAQEGVANLLRQARCEDVQIINLVGGAMSLHIARKTRLLGPQRHDVSLEASHFVTQR